MIFVPAPNFYSLALAEKYNTAINKSGLSSFSISQIFILIYHSSTSNSSENNFSSVEDYILEKSIYINQECNIIDIINRAINESETLDKFTKRYTEFGIFNCKDEKSKYDFRLICKRKVCFCEGQVFVNGNFLQKILICYTVKRCPDSFQVLVIIVRFISCKWLVFKIFANAISMSLLPKDAWMASPSLP